MQLSSLFSFDRLSLARETQSGRMYDRSNSQRTSMMDRGGDRVVSPPAPVDAAYFDVQPQALAS